MRRDFDQHGAGSGDPGPVRADHRRQGPGISAAHRHHQSGRRRSRRQRFPASVPGRGPDQNFQRFDLLLALDEKNGLVSGAKQLNLFTLVKPFDARF